MFLWRSTKGVKMLCPTRFFVNATENSEGGGVAAEVAAPRPGYEQNQQSTYYCYYEGHQNEVTFVGGISERRPKS